jgi:hypothetical protein
LASKYALKNPHFLDKSGIIFTFGTWYNKKLFATENIKCPLAFLAVPRKLQLPPYIQIRNASLHSGSILDLVAHGDEVGEAILNEE